MKMKFDKILSYLEGEVLMKGYWEQDIAEKDMRRIYLLDRPEPDGTRPVKGFIDEDGCGMWGKAMLSNRQVLAEFQSWFDNEIMPFWGGNRWRYL